VSRDELVRELLDERFGTVAEVVREASCRPARVIARRRRVLAGSLRESA
jgi:hypothetical protein